MDGSAPRTPGEQGAVRLLLEASGERFEALTREVRAGRRWSLCDGPLFETLRAHAWSADLLLLSDVALRPHGARAELRSLLRRTGCPVLVWPERLGPRALESAAVLCDESPASLHAVRSAAPILSRCSRVTLVGAGPHAVQLKRGLQARGVADVRVAPLHPALSHVAAERLAEARADVVVAGAWPEPLGGWPRRSVSDLLLADAAAPVFLAS